MRAKVLVTGADGFVGRNLCSAIASRDDVTVVPYDLQTPADVLDRGLDVADVVYHLAGVNRPQSPDDYAAVNERFTEEICEKLARRRRTPTVVLASSTQAALDNPYGASKRAAEEALRRFCKTSGATGVVHRLKNLFGKWCRPNYNSVTATFCHNIARGLPIHISDATTELDLTYIDDAVAAFAEEIRSPTAGGYRLAPPLPSHQTTLGRLAELIQSFHDHRTTLRLPDFSESFTRALYTTYLSYLPTRELQLRLGSQDRRSRQPCRVLQGVIFRSNLPLEDPPGRYTWEPLPQHEGGEVPRSRRRGGHQAPIGH